MKFTYKKLSTLRHKQSLHIYVCSIPNLVNENDFSLTGFKAIHFSWLGPELLVCCLAHRGPTDVFSLAPELVSYLAPRDLHRRAAY